MKLGKLIISAHSIWLFMKLCVMKQILMISNQKPNSMPKLRYHSLLVTPSNFLCDLTKMKIINYTTLVKCNNVDGELEDLEILK